MQLFIFILVDYSNQYRHVHVCFSKGDLVPFPVGHPDDLLSSLSISSLLLHLRCAIYLVIIDI